MSMILGGRIMNELVRALGQEQLKKEVPNFGPGDTVRVHVKIVEGKRERIQVFEGVVLKRQGGGIQETFTVRKISFNVGVERTFPVHSPRIEKIEVTRKGKVKRAKYNSTKLIGVVSNSYAFCLGATKEELDKKEKMPIGLLGRVSINIIGEVAAGDFIICNGNGIGKAIKSSCSQFTGSIVGRALESNNNRSIKKVLCLIHVL